MDISQVLVSIADSFATATATAEAEALTPPETPASFNLTQRVLVHMLRENTGASILDSGGAKFDGRHWQRNQLVDFSKREAATVEFRAYAYGDKPAQLETNVTLDLFHYLSAVCTYDRALTRQLRKFAALPANEDSHWLSIAEAFPEWIADKRGARADNVVCENTRGLHPHRCGPSFSVNGKTPKPRSSREFSRPRPGVLRASLQIVEVRALHATKHGDSIALDCD
jgi:hypothetical protein